MLLAWFIYYKSVLHKTLLAIKSVAFLLLWWVYTSLLIAQIERLIMLESFYRFYSWTKIPVTNSYYVVIKLKNFLKYIVLSSKVLSDFVKLDYYGCCHAFLIIWSIIKKDKYR